ncbi:MAG: monooxygenase [Polyangiales bacterium]
MSVDRSSSLARFARPSRLAGAWLGKLALCMLWSCSGSTVSTPADSSDSGTTAAALTWHRDVRPIVEQKCQSCHVDGGFAPFALMTYDEAFGHRNVMASAIETEIMPPWPPNDACNQYQNDRSLTDAQRTILSAWARGDAAEGDPSTYIAPPASTPAALRVDKSLALATPYTPVMSPDEYRCFVMDWDATTTQYVTGLRVVPGDIAEVHHAILFNINPADVAAIESLDAADPAPGYSCFGGPGVNSAGWVGAWAPGSLGDVFPADTGIAIAPGSKLVVQMHYNTANASPAPDQSSVQVQLADSVKIPAAVLKWANPSWPSKHTMTINAGDPDSVQSFSFAPYNFMSKFSGGVLQDGAPFTIWSAALHMHARGVKGTLTIAHADGTNDCALEIDDWSFHWQGSYALKQNIVVQPGDTISIECHFDNSGARQPILNGVPLPVGPVNWGETTEDEMCLGLFYATP